jgi:putative lipoprotein
MRKLAVAPLFLATLVLAGCGASNSSGNDSAVPSAEPSASPSASTPAPAATVVTGTVKLQDPSTVVAPDAKLELALVDVTQQPGVTVNTQDFTPPTFPQAFRLPFAASAINAKDLYVLQATMQNNGRTYSTKIQQPVLTRGQSAHVDLALVPEPTPAEKMLDAFDQAKRETGGMTAKQGTSSKIGESHSWQVFSDVHGVEFIIEQTNQADHGFTKTEYAYRDGLPWVVVQEQMPQANAPATSTAKVGWSSDGVVVLNQQISGGKTATLSDATAKALHADAEAQYRRFTKQQH